MTHRRETDRESPDTLARSVPGIVAVLLLAAGLAAAPQAARDPGEPPPETDYAETLHVDLVQLDVVVTDADGQPVHGLTADDFRVREDGKRVKLTNFREIRRASVEDPATPSATTASPAERDTHIVLLIDNFSIHPADRIRIVSAARDYVAERDFGDAWIAVASYEGYLRMRQTFTRDRGRLLAAIDGLAAVSPLGTALIADRTATFRHGLDTLRSIQAVADTLEDDELARVLTSFSRRITAYAEDIRLQNRSTFWAIGNLVNALSPLPGRKAVVFVSEGLPARPGEEIQAAVDQVGSKLFMGRDMRSLRSREADIDRRSGALDVLSQSAPSPGRRQRDAAGRTGARADGLLELTAMANAYQVSFYTLRPLTEYGGVPAEIGGNAAKIYTPAIQQARVRNLAETLESMASDTGGVAYAATGIDRLFDRVARDLGDHYSIAYATDHPGDGRYHEIEVKVSGRKLRVQHRNGYVDKSIEAKIADHTTAALVMGIDHNPHGIVLGTAAPEPGPQDKQWVVPVEVEIPLAALVLTEQGDSLVSNARLFVGSRTVRGRSAPVQAYDLRIEVPRSTAEPHKRSYTARFDLLLGPGAQRLAIGLVDEAAEVVSFVSRDIDVGADG